MISPALPPLPHNFHDGEITAIHLGPRREARLTVSIALLPLGRKAGVMAWHDYHLRFGGIVNYAEVEEFFCAKPQVSRIAALDYADDEISRSNRLVFRLAMDDDSRLVIRCSNVTVWQNDGDGGDSQPRA